MMGLMNLGSLFPALAVPARDIIWIATLAALSTACVMSSIIFICLLAMLLLCLTGFCVLLLTLPFWDCIFLSTWLAETAYLILPNIPCFILPFWDLLTSCSVSCLSENDNDVWLLGYLLLCVNKLHCYSKCICLYIKMWCTLAGYIHDGNWLYYLHKCGHTSWCSTARLGHP